MKTLRPIKTLLSLGLALIAGSAWSDDAALRRCRNLEGAAARLACYDALPLGAAAAAPPAVASGTAAGAAVATSPLAATFGLQRADEVVLEVVSSISGLFDGWRPSDRIRLANGQLWQVSDDSSAVYQLRDPKVTVRRAAMGTFVLDIEGARRQPRVRRLE